MAVDQLTKKGDEALLDKDYDTAISLFNSALEENPKAFQALLKRATAFQRLKNFNEAKKDLTDALQVALDRGKRSDMGLTYFKLGMVHYAEKKVALALENFEKAKEYDCHDATLETWLVKAKYDVDKLKSKAEASSDNTARTEAPQVQGNSAPSQLEPSSHIDTINKHAPLKIKIRDDWYQSSNDVIITIFAKNIREDQLKIDFSSSSVSISFPSGDNSEYNYNLDPLYGKIDPKESKYKVYGTKLEISLRKEQPIKWSSLEQSESAATLTNPTIMSQANSGSAASVYPTSSKKAVNWSNFKVAEDEAEDSSENDFFAKLYKDNDEDTRRAMMKSYVESNGTVLTTNWSEAKDKKFETSPPEGMVAKKWGEQSKNQK
ncbi:protein Sgt1p [[Candida] railenensis]|uniref:Protein Sgt1p n=1 Tax=[Candida] railenensis TaxID=45579 RepID=A0A9P0QQC5_9ASCO|nr:protein Sgt1p [[Candida] railenensis]